MELAIIEFSDIESLSTYICFESRLVYMSLEAISSKPNTFTLGSPLVHVRVGESVAVTTDKKSGTPVQFTLHHESHSIKRVHIVRVLAFHVLQEAHPLRLSINDRPFIRRRYLLSLVSSRLISHNTVRMHYLNGHLLVLVSASLNFCYRSILWILKIYHLSLFFIFVVLHHCSGLNVTVKRICTLRLLLLRT
jgi:hypothetical protein